MDVLAALARSVADAWPSISPAVYTLIGLAFGSWLESHRASRVYRRGLTDAKLGRLREAFHPLIASAWGYVSAANEMTWGIEGETPEQRATRINALLVDSTKGLDDARVRLTLETDAKPFIEKFHELYLAFRTYVNLMAEVAQGNIPQPILETKQKIQALADELETMIRDEIRRLERAD